MFFAVVCTKKIIHPKNPSEEKSQTILLVFDKTL